MTPKTKLSHRFVFFRKPLKEVGLFLLDIVYNAVVIIILVVLIRTFLISPFRVIGSSMADTLENNEFILIDKLSYRVDEPQRGDPIVFLPPVTNKNAPKFEESVLTDPTGVGTLDIHNLKTRKSSFYCRNSMAKSFWFCQDLVQPGDLAYFLLIGAGDNGLSILNTRLVQKTIVTADDIKKGELILKYKASQSIIVRIYNANGPEYFVKRIIGLPGDAVRLENGRVYLKTPQDSDFKELSETYLNNENHFNTYFKSESGKNEFTVPAGSYFVLGDNRTHSNDSRHWFSPIDEKPTPFISEESISGRVMVVLWPLSKLGFISSGVLR